jgi:ppGpp synthetase/RelA/SpoT-type nucleotidyltranferase
LGAINTESVRRVVYYTEEVQKVEDLIKENFIVDLENTINKIEQLPKNQFGYGGMHYVVSLPKEKTDLPENDKYRQMKAEIQIHTLC